MTTPNLQQLAANVPPAIRDFVAAAVAAALAEHAPPPSKPDGYDDLVAEVASLRAQLADLKKRYETDDRFTITRAKVINWMRKAGID